MKSKYILNLIPLFIFLLSSIFYVNAEENKNKNKNEIKNKPNQTPKILCKDFPICKEWVNSDMKKKKK